MALLSQIPEDLKNGREHALLGYYDPAIVCYEGVCAAMKQQIEKSAGATKENWQLVLNNKLCSMHFLFYSILKIFCFF